MNNKRNFLLLSLSSLLLFLLTACSTGSTSQAVVPGEEIYRENLNFTAAGEEVLFTIPVETEGIILALNARGVTEGQVSFQLIDPSGSVQWDPGQFGGEWSFNMFPEAAIAGDYVVKAYWNGPLSGDYMISWMIQGDNPVQPWALVSGVGMVLAAFAFVTYAAMNRLGGRYMLLGAAAWMVSVALKFAWAIMANNPIYNLLYTTFAEPIAGPIFWIYVGALTGVFEVGVVYLWLRKSKFGRASWKHALAFGIGFGSVEALLLGLLNLISTGTALLIPDQLGAAALNSIAQQNNLLYSLAPVVERIFTILVHIFCNVAIFYAINASQPKWFWFAVILKTGIDAIAAYAQTNWINSLAFLWAIEAFVVLFGLIGLYGTYKLSKMYPPVEGDTPSPVVTTEAPENV